MPARPLSPPRRGGRKSPSDGETDRPGGQISTSAKLDTGPDRAAEEPVMPRPRLPTPVHELKGTYLHDPRRRGKAEPKPRGPLGPPPDCLDEVQTQAWC